jgi:hypothetical protein
MVSGIILNFKHLLKLCVFFLNTINITLVGLLFFLSFYRKKREKRKMKKEKRKKREKNKPMLYNQRDYLQHN